MEGHNASPSSFEFLERVQKMATKMIRGQEAKTYKEQQNWVCLVSEEKDQG